MFYEKLIWMKVAEDGYPPCDSETLFVGMNSAGYCGCFNEHGLMSTMQGQRSVCLYATAEGCDEVMTDLAWWAKLETPNAIGQARPQGVACTDGLGVAVPPAPTFEGGNDEH